MTYIDENLCTGCGICLDVCNRDAISIGESIATIDEGLCTSCGRCMDVCPNGAIISVEAVSETPATTFPARSPQASQPLWAGTAPLSPAGSGAAAPAAASPAPAGSVPSKLEVAERVLSGLLNFAAFVLDRRQDRLAGRAALSRSGALGIGRNTRGVTAASSACPGRRKARAGRRGPGAGQGLGKGQGHGGARGSGRGGGHRGGGKN